MYADGEAQTKNEANPADPKGKPYEYKGKNGPFRCSRMKRTASSV
jgi:hypothetical protein